MPGERRWGKCWILYSHENWGREPPVSGTLKPSLLFTLLPAAVHPGTLSQLASSAVFSIASGSFVFSHSGYLELFLNIWPGGTSQFCTSPPCPTLFFNILVLLKFGKKFPTQCMFSLNLSGWHWLIQLYRLQSPHVLILSIVISISNVGSHSNTSQNSPEKRRLYIHTHVCSFYIHSSYVYTHIEFDYIYFWC